VARVVWLAVVVLTLGLAIPGFVVAIAVVVLVVLSPGLPEGLLRLPPAREGMSAWHRRAAVLGVLALWGIGLAAQIYRHRRVSGPVERQQAKLVMFTFGTIMAVIALGIVLPSLFLDLPDVWFATVLLACVPLGIAFPLSIAIAILRYRLYDIDRIISRTLSYALVTALLAGVYASVVLILGQVFGGVGAELPSWTVAAATPAAPAAAFRPPAATSRRSYTGPARWPRTRELSQARMRLDPLHAIYGMAPGRVEADSVRARERPGRGVRE
jgi:hypothetical protein